MVYDLLSKSQDLARIDFAKYIRQLVDNLIPSDKQIKPIYKIESIQFNMETAQPCGLIINELVTNSIKHAFPEKYIKNKEIQIVLDVIADNKYKLIVSDNGVGMSPEIDLEKANSLGFRLVRLLAKQLKATIEPENVSSGTSFCVIFSEPDYPNRL